MTRSSSSSKPFNSTKRNRGVIFVGALKIRGVLFVLCLFGGWVQQIGKEDRSMVNARVVNVKLDNPEPISDGFQSSENFVKEFKKKFQIKIQKVTDELIIFDLIGVDASIANALRRILLAEVPTMAIEHVYLYNNTSIIQDEVLAHRLGLIPINVDPRSFDSFPEHEEGEATDQNTIVFKLDVQCKKNKEFPNDLSKAEHASVYAKDLEWVPQGSQLERFGSIRPVEEDILIAKLRPGQAITLEAHCRKGVGKDHAKFSPVCTASYRLLQVITLPEDIVGADAEELKKKCPLNVFDIEDLGKQKRAVVARPRDCTMCRECIRAPGWENRVKLTRKSDHFVFSVESVGMIKAKELFSEAINVLIEKIDVVLQSLDELEEQSMIVE